MSDINEMQNIINRMKSNNEQMKQLYDELTADRDRYKAALDSIRWGVRKKDNSTLMGCENYEDGLRILALLNDGNDDHELVPESEYWMECYQDHSSRYKAALEEIDKLERRNLRAENKLKLISDIIDKALRGEG